METPTVTVHLVGQVASLDAPARVLRNSTYPITGVFYPARPGRAVVLQRRSGSCWVQVSSGSQNVNGMVTFTRSASSLGSTTFRMVALSYRGAAEFATPSRTVSVVASGDVTAPSVPSGVGATSSGATVTLTWQAVSAGDLRGYHVYRGQTAHGPWTRLTDGPVTGTQWVDPSPNPDAAWYAITSIDTSGNQSARSATVQPGNGDTTAPPVPAGLAATAGDGEVELAWDAVSAGDLAGYRVYQSVGASGDWTQVGGLHPGAGSTLTVTGLTNGTEYRFAVTAVDDSGNESDRSEVALVTPQDGTPPPVPAGLTATAGDGQVELAWVPLSTGDLAGYRVYQSVGASGDWTQVGGLHPGAGSTLTVTGLTNGTEYRFAVTSVDDSGNESDRSEAVSATPQDGTPPAVPTGLTATPGDGEVELAWNAVSAADLAGYRVYQLAEGGQTWTQLGALHTGTGFTVTGLTNGVEFQFTVTAVDEEGNESNRSEEANATPLDATAPPAPTGLTATPGEGQVELAWDVVSADDLAGYHVYRATDQNGPWTQVLGGAVPRPRPHRHRVGQRHRVLLPGHRGRPERQRVGARLRFGHTRRHHGAAGADRLGGHGR